MFQSMLMLLELMESGTTQQDGKHILVQEELKLMN